MVDGGSGGRVSRPAGAASGAGGTTGLSGAAAGQRPPRVHYCAVAGAGPWAAGPGIPEPRRAPVPPWRTTQRAPSARAAGVRTQVQRPTRGGRSGGRSRHGACGGGALPGRTAGCDPPGDRRRVLFHACRHRGPRCPGALHSVGGAGWPPPRIGGSGTAAGAGGRWPELASRRADGRAEGTGPPRRE